MEFPKIEVRHKWMNRPFHCPSLPSQYIALYQPSAITDNGQQMTPVFRPSVCFQGVTFHYPTRFDQPILKDFSLEVPAGAVVALCGPSGAGKTTLAALLERFYDPDKGRISVGKFLLVRGEKFFLEAKSV